MRIPSLVRNGLLLLTVLLALGVMFITPVFSESPAGRAYEPAGILIDLLALAAIAAAALVALRGRRPRTRT